MVERPPRLADLSALQVRRASTIARVARPFGFEAVKAVLMCAFEESSYLITANNGRSTRTDVGRAWLDLAALSMELPHDAVAGEADTTADSLGLFQQRLKYDYAPPNRAGVAMLMDPVESTRIFLTGSYRGRTRFYLDPRNTGGDIASRIQWAQGSEFPTGDNYRPNEGLADELIALFGFTPPAPSMSATDWLRLFAAATT